MYEQNELDEQKVLTPTKQPEHYAIAMDFANQMSERFNPVQLNEIVKIIKTRIAERREMEIEETAKKLAYLKETLENL
jgi:hypothetical protein